MLQSFSSMNFYSRTFDCCGSVLFRIHLEFFLKISQVEFGKIFCPKEIHLDCIRFFLIKKLKLDRKVFFSKVLDFKIEELICALHYQLTLI